MRVFQPKYRGKHRDGHTQVDPFVAELHVRFSQGEDVGVIKKKEGLTIRLAQDEDSTDWAAGEYGVIPPSGTSSVTWFNARPLIGESGKTVERPEFLYGLPWSETLYVDAEEIWEKGGWAEVPESIEVEKWTVCDPRALLPHPGTVIENIIEVAETEELSDAYMKVAPVGGEIEALIEQALELLAERVDYYMADRKVSTFVMVRPPGLKV